MLGLTQDLNSEERKRKPWRPKLRREEEKTSVDSTV